MIDLFVYGSLKRAEANHAQLGGARCLREARTSPLYELVLIAGYPALRLGGERSIWGELYQVASAQLVQLDHFEGVDYLRGEVWLFDGEVAEAYLLAPSRAGLQVFAGDSWPPLRPAAQTVR